MPQVGVPLNGSEITRLREALLMTQDQLAAKAGIHPNTLYRCESDETYRAGFKTVKAIARRLKVDPTSLVKNGDEPAEGAA